jgi:hypothetical protein
MDYKNELLNILKYCKDSANYITDDDCTEDKYARMAYNDVISEIEKTLEREQKLIETPANAPLVDVSKCEGSARATLIAFLDFCDKHNHFPLIDTFETIDEFLKSN